MQLDHRRKSPHGAGSLGTSSLGGLYRNDTTGDPLQRVLDRLDDARRSGGGWVARCPSHEDRGPSLSLSEGRDGRVLLHCFAGCSAGDVLGAIGLALTDLFPNRLDGRPLTLTERKAMTERARLSRWQAAWNAVLHEAAIVETAARELGAGHPLEPDDVKRVGIAADRLAAARVEIAQLEQHGDADCVGPRPGRFFDDLGMRHLTPPIARKEAA